ncbi:hypothetical protein [Limnobaculum xujianqingii]|uniref:hypothetical protein n=1 Tax=Limnobaculum xujianqingii TaxID=2738837 RepID=UPI00112EDBEE|nr:hypothetical protein [Limnobaculum xujianqingii]
MIEKIEWLENEEEYFLKNDGADLYELILTMLKKQRMSFSSFLYDASRGIGNTIREGLGCSLDQDLDNPDEFDGVIFWFGDYESSTITPQHFVRLMQAMSDSYINYHPNDKVKIEGYMNKLKERYL